jgi:hypothetical protein
MNYGNVFSYLIIALIVIVGLFLLLREFWCWYWKINKKINLIEEQNEMLKTINNNLLKNQEINNKISRLLKSSENKTDNHVIDKLI